MLQVPYKGEPAGVVDLVAGRVDVMFGDTHHRNGPSSRKDACVRSAWSWMVGSTLLPEVPTMAEAGMPRFVNVTWAAILGPAEMPQDIVARLNVAITEALKHPAVREHLDRQAIEVAGSTPEQLAAFIKDQIDVWKRTTSANRDETQ